MLRILIPESFFNCCLGFSWAGAMTDVTFSFVGLEGATPVGGDAAEGLAKEQNSEEEAEGE